MVVVEYQQQSVAFVYSDVHHEHVVENPEINSKCKSSFYDYLEQTGICSIVSSLSLRDIDGGDRRKSVINKLFSLLQLEKNTHCHLYDAMIMMV